VLRCWTYSAIQFWIEELPLNETTIRPSTGSTPTKPLVSSTVPLFELVSHGLGECLELQGGF
jgi:hypothetical protein